ncbi:MAG TPA: HEPN domain-containing protein, partial [Methylomirabilota bacterium]|nr:HEPN domain-containing protein [Methylomirabilota bacterium]
HCQAISSSSGIGTEREQIGEQEYSAEVAFIGTHFTDPQQILFNKIDTHYNYLPQWAGIFPYYGHQKPFNEVSASTTRGTITVESIQSFWMESTQKTDLIKQADLPEIVRIRYEIQETLPLAEWITQFVSPLQNLISLATQRPNAIVNIVGYIKQGGGEQANGDISEVAVQIAFPPDIIPIPTNKNTFPETILFSLQEIESNFSFIIETWLRLVDELDSTFRLFFGVQYTNLPLDLRFLLTAQAVEAYQDHRFEKSAFSEEVYQNMMKTVLDACPEQQREWLEETLEHKNNATFRQQLRNFVAVTNPMLQPLLGKSSKERSAFTEVVYNTRNYLTHHTKQLFSKAASGVELFYITQCLSLALQVCLMKELGFSTQRLTEVIHKHESYRYMPSLQSQVDLEKLRENAI